MSDLNTCLRLLQDESRAMAPIDVDALMPLEADMAEIDVDGADGEHRFLSQLRRTLPFLTKRGALTVEEEISACQLFIWLREALVAWSGPMDRASSQQSLVRSLIVANELDWNRSLWPILAPIVRENANLRLATAELIKVQTYDLVAKVPHAMQEEGGLERAKAELATNNWLSIGQRIFRLGPPWPTRVARQAVRLLKACAENELVEALTSVSDVMVVRDLLGALSEDEALQAGVMSSNSAVPDRGS